VQCPPTATHAQLSPPLQDLHPLVAAWLPSQPDGDHGVLTARFLLQRRKPVASLPGRAPACCGDDDFLLQRKPSKIQCTRETEDSVS
jgi:hypothetical protein